jgi:hypothetical protein
MSVNEKSPPLKGKEELVTPARAQVKQERIEDLI